MARPFKSHASRHRRVCAAVNPDYAVRIESMKDPHQQRRGIVRALRAGQRVRREIVAGALANGWQPSADLAQEIQRIMTTSNPQQPEQPVDQTVTQDYQGDLAQTLSTLQLTASSANVVPAPVPALEELPKTDRVSQARQRAREAAPEAVEVLISLMRNQQAPASVRRQAAIGVLEYADSPEPIRKDKPLGQMTAAELRELRDKLREQERVIDGEAEVVPDGQ